MSVSNSEDMHNTALLYWDSQLQYSPLLVDALRCPQFSYTSTVPELPAVWPSPPPPYINDIAAAAHVITVYAVVTNYFSKQQQPSLSSLSS